LSITSPPRCGRLLLTRASAPIESAARDAPLRFVNLRLELLDCPLDVVLLCHHTAFSLHANSNARKQASQQNDRAARAVNRAFQSSRTARISSRRLLAQRVVRLDVRFPLTSGSCGLNGKSFGPIPISIIA
jgi:hypothetical protein